MPSAKGKPADSKPRKKVAEGAKNEISKDGGSKEPMAAAKAAKSGDNENDVGSKGKPKKDPSENKPDTVKAKETKSSPKDKAIDDKEDGKEASSDVKAVENGVSVEKDAPETEEKPKANTSKKATKAANEKKAAPAKEKKTAPAKEKKEPAKGTRTSSRQAAVPKRKMAEGDGEEEAEAEEKKPATKKAKAKAAPKADAAKEKVANESKGTKKAKK